MQTSKTQSRFNERTSVLVRTVLLTLFTLTAFAANSIVCRMALDGGHIDPAGFTFVRLASGALALMMILRVNHPPADLTTRGSWISASMLFLYAAAFSFAYIDLSAGMGALILFGAVQSTMICTGLVQGERPHGMTWFGLAAALSGLVYLVLPGLEAPPLSGSVLMALAGVSWGVYSLRGFDIQHPVAVTSENFVRSIPFAAALLLTAAFKLHVSASGMLLACLSGALFSGVGYVLWYAALRYLSATLAATLQLLVPIIAAFGGVLFLSEQITSRLMLAAALIIGGVGLTLFFRGR